MGIYLNPGYENFESIINDRIYVDKTMMLAETNSMIGTVEKYICISRPRRFGKTIASEMLSAYYTKGADSHTLFDGLKIAGDKSYEEKLNKYNVIKIDLNSEYQMATDKRNLIEEITASVRKELKKSFCDVDIEDDFTLAKCILTVYAEKKEQFIVIIDEYDVLVREQVDKELFERYLSFLNGLFKSATLRPAIALAYLTGILPVVRDKVQSKLNNFREYTIIDAVNLAPYIGFTTEEVKNLCKEYGMDYEECRRWYDGYELNGHEIYNPESVVQAMLRHRYDGYWNRTSSYEAISDRIKANFDGVKDAVIRMLSGEHVEVNVTRYLNTMDSFTDKGDVFTYLIHLGYLAYEQDEAAARIPNREIRNEWYNAIISNDEYKVTNTLIENSKQLLLDTIIREMTAGKGFADVTFIPFKEGRPAMVMELKRNDTAKSGLKQIREKRYYDSLKHYEGEMLLVGISYDEKEKTHSCKIERI